MPFPEPRMLDRLPHDVLVDLARSFDVVDRVVLSEVCRACRDATREALAVDRRFGTRADSHGDQEWGPPGDREHLALRSVSRLTWAQEHGLKLETWGPRMLLRYAAEVGNVELLNELPKPAYKDEWMHAMVRAARGGKIDNLIWLSSSLEKEEYASEFYSTFWEYSERVIWERAVQYGHVHVLEWFMESILRGEKRRFDGKVVSAIMSATNNGHVEVLKWIHLTFDPIGEPVLAEELPAEISLMLEIAVRHGHMDVARWFLETYGPVALKNNWQPLLNAKLTMVAAEAGEFDMLRWLLAQGCPEHPMYLERLVTSRPWPLRGGRPYREIDVGCVKWAHERGLQLSEQVMEAAIKRNDPDSVRWLHDNGCPVSRDAVKRLMQNQNIDMLRLLVEECGAHFDASEIKCSDLMEFESYGAYNITLINGKGCIEVVEYLRHRGCEWGSIMTQAVRENNLELMKWLHENGCPGLEWDQTLEQCNGTPDMYLWMLSVLGPKEREELWIQATKYDEAENGPQSVKEWEDRLRGEWNEIPERRRGDPRLW